MKESKIANGRTAVYVPDHPAANNRGYVLRSRYHMEQHIGRYLLPEEEVHHKDENKLNDAISNLEIKSKAEHTRHHRTVLDYALIQTYIEEGFGYKKIAKLTGSNVNATKSACRLLKRGTR